jgi:predicted DCC family thiol-disulfide oxidoreductase YuxK
MKLRAPLLIFDGNCGFCTSAARFARVRVRPGLLAEPFQEADLDALGVSRERAAREVLLVQPGGRVYGGSEAVGRLLMAGGGVWAAAGAAILLPWIAPAAYRLVSAYRHRLPGGTPRCAIRRPIAEAHDQPDRS